MKRRYPAYKDSGVEWLREVPDGWEVKRLRKVATLNPSKSEASDVSRDTQVSFLPMEAVGENSELDLSRTRSIGEVETGYTYFRDGDMAFAKITPCFENGKRALMRGLTEGMGFGTTELTVIRPMPKVLDPEFLFWLVSAPEFRRVGEAHMYGAGGQKRVPDDFVRDFSFGVPPLPEQRAIAGFLDREVAKLDGLVAEQRRLIALLAEKRQAVISHAVTRGLDPTAPLKPSGIDWLGDIPEGWEVAKIGAVCERMTYGFTNPMPTTVDGPFMLTAADIVDGRINYGSARLTSEEAFQTLLTDKSRPVQGDVLVTKDGTLGRVAVADGSRVCINQSVALLRPRQEIVIPDFLCQILSADVYQARMLFDAGGTTIKHIYISRLAQMPIAVPSIKAQSEILDWLAEKRPELDTLTTTAQSAITLLQERRAALISAAVTGKIDVRDLASHETEAA